ncbi:hypothetical protein IMSAG185_01575 [Lachnospiraceae bacterium]|jgi:hypothetical protein|nr:hypothetical protein IMSAG185_01575 [Lachnospiraceae bacterium]
MGIDVGREKANTNKLSIFAQDLRSAKRKISRYGSELNNHWEGSEVACYGKAISDIETRLGSAAAELEALAGAVALAAEEICREEEEQRRREEEARRRREEEAQRRREEEMRKAREEEQRRQAEEAERQEEEQEELERAAMAAAAAAASSVLNLFGRGSFHL